MIETVHEWTENPIYCHKLVQVLDADNQHLGTHCTQCPYYHGSAQGQGTECWYYDGTNEPIAVNVNADELATRMRKVDQQFVDKLINSRGSRAKQSRLASALKALTNRQRYKILKDGKYLGRIEFSAEIAINLSSQNAALVQKVQHMIVNPVDLDGGKYAPGSELYPTAVIKSLESLDYRIEPI